MITGDFNDKCVTWTDDHTESELSNKLVDLINTCNLHQIIDEPTRITANSASLLDIIITDSPGYIMDSGTLPPLSNLDHSCSYCKLKIRYLKETMYQRNIWDYKNADFDGLNEHLRNAPWDVGLDTFDDIDDSVGYFTTLLITTAKDYIPNKTVLIRPKDKPWVTNNIRKLFRKRDRCFKKFKRTHLPDHEIHYKKLSKKQI